MKRKLAGFFTLLTVVGLTVLGSALAKGVSTNGCGYWFDDGQYLIWIKTGC